jgi:hypothetical protein
VWFKNEPIFPCAWIGHSCTVWAMNTSIGFLQEFEKLADLRDQTNWKDFQSRMTP